LCPWNLLWAAIQFASETAVNREGIGINHLLGVALPAILLHKSGNIPALGRVTPDLDRFFVAAFAKNDVVALFSTRLALPGLPRGNRLACWSLDHFLELTYLYVIGRNACRCAIHSLSRWLGQNPRVTCLGQHDFLVSG
jgi:hypothetical protein